MSRQIEESCRMSRRIEGLRVPDEPPDEPPDCGEVPDKEGLPDGADGGKVLDKPPDEELPVRR